MYETLIAALRKVDEYDSGYAKLMYDAADAIEELAKNLPKLDSGFGEWIPVTERLPEYDTNCIVFSGGEVKEAHFYYGKFYDPIEDYMRYNATHWMPLPSPPVEE